MKISKWQPNGTNSPPRYYLNGFKSMPSGVKAFIECGKNGKLQLVSVDAPDVNLACILKELLEATLISQPEFDVPTIEVFARLAEFKGQANSSTSRPIKQAANFATTTPNKGMPPRNNSAIVVEPITLDKEVCITIDHREPKEIFDAFSAIKGVKIDMQVLSVGDFVFAGGIVERKSSNDFSESIIDRRIFNQS